MTPQSICLRYEALLADLSQIVKQSEERIIRDSPDAFFVSNANFLTKSYLINLCTYLEAYLKEMALLHVANVKKALVAANLPHNLVVWSLDPEVKDKDLGFKRFELPLEKKVIDDALSGNPYKTGKTFRYLGVDLESADGFKELKEFINSVVSKRNNIVHHNDTAADVSLGDLLTYIRNFSEYIKIVELAVSKTSA